MDLVSKIINKDRNKYMIDMSANHILTYIYIPPLMLLPQELANFERIDFDNLILNRNKNGINYKQIKLRTTQNIKAKISLFKNSELATVVENMYSFISPSSKNYVLPYASFILQFDFSLNTINFYYNGMINIIPSGNSFSNEGQKNYDMELIFAKKQTMFGANQIGKLIWSDYVY
jgi:hypothetical protein